MVLVRGVHQLVRPDPPARLEDPRVDPNPQTGRMRV